jgi:hypothetical protein
MIAFISRRRPLSIQANGCQKYKLLIAADFDGCQFKGMPLSDELYAKIYHFVKGKHTGDVDNISKPIVDSLRGKAYPDDNLVLYRVASRINLESDEISEFNVTDIPDDILNDLLDCWDSVEQFVYIEIGKFEKRMVKFGE